MTKEVLECRVIFHDPSHLHFKKTKDNHVFRTGQYQPLYLKLDQTTLKFYAEKHSIEEVCSVSTQRMNVEVDKNAKISVISFVYHNNQDPTLEIRSDINTLEKIEHHVTTAVKLNYKSPLAYTPANRHRETVFTTGDNSVNLKGFLNLALIALVFAKFRDIIKNFLAYGMVVTAAVEVSVTLTELICYSLSATGPTLFIWWLERQGLMKKIPDRLIDFLAKVNILILLIIPIVVCNIVKPHPVSGILYVTAMIGNVLKMCSYIDVMGHLRRNVPKILKLHKDGKDVIATMGDHIISKENLEIILQRSDDVSNLASFKDLVYFLTIPTFCYQLWYPRNPRIRWGFLAKRICENTVCWALFSFVMSQYIVPLMDESVEILEKGSVLEIIERVIRLAFPVTVCWILFFFGIFQFTFNILAEIQRFSDRMFYKDWWNCRDLNEYWRLWNLPIHEFFTRHVYYPLLSNGYSKSFAKLVVFFLSAVAHEYWASVPLRLIAAWAFLLMLIQLPLMLLELKLDKMLKGSQIGNIFFWISFCFVGQPMALLLYYQLYITKHGDSS